MDPTQLTVQVFLIDGGAGTATSWDSSDKSVYVVLSDGSKVANRVRVIVTYTWKPSILNPTPITMQSISEAPMAF
jgi:hypothetical protein